MELSSYLNGWSIHCQLRLLINPFTGICPICILGQNIWMRRRIISWRKPGAFEKQWWSFSQWYFPISAQREAGAEQNHLSSHLFTLSEGLSKSVKNRWNRVLNFAYCSNVMRNFNVGDTGGSERAKISVLSVDQPLKMFLDALQDNCSYLYEQKACK